MSRKSVWVLSIALGLAGCHESGDKGHAHTGDKPAETAHAHAETEAKAADKGHDHGHADPDKAAAGLRLDNGKKWQPDAPARTGMTAIRDHLQAAVKPIHAKTYTPDDYKALAEKIEKEIGTMVANCKLPKEVDDQFHLVLIQISAGAELMKKDGDRMQGAVKVIQGLGSYAKYFEHPDWKPIEH